DADDDVVRFRREMEAVFSPPANSRDSEELSVYTFQKPGDQGIIPSNTLQHNFLARLGEFMVRFRATLSLMLFACATPVALMAQASTGSMSGTVTDPNGASVPAAKVIATGAA